MVGVSLGGDVTVELHDAHAYHWFTPTHKACSLKAVWAQTNSHIRNKVKIFSNISEELSSHFPAKAFAIVGPCGGKLEKQLDAISGGHRCVFE